MKLTFARCLCCAILLLAGQHPAAAAGETDAEIKTILQERIDKAGGNAAMVVGLIDGQGSRIVSAGKLDNSAGGTVDGDTLFEIDSITKTFTTLLLADMVKRGEVKLEDPISKYLPASVKVPTRNGREITLVDLATHTSGLPRLPDNFKPRDRQDPYADYTEKDLYEFLSHYPLSRDIGAEFEYSNIGMELLGHILSLRAGTNYESLVVNRICAPLSMNSTRLNLTPEQKSRFAAGHNESGKRVKAWSMPLPGDGGIRSSVRDLLKYLSANLGLTKTELQPAMELQQIPRHAADAPSLRVGLGWMIIKLYGAEVVWHNGGSYGYHSFIGFDRKHLRGVVVLSSSAQDIDDIGMGLLVHNDEPPAKHAAIKLDPKIYDQYAGRYQLGPDVELTVRREGGHLYVRLTGQDFLEIFPESETNFFLKAVEAQLSFVKNPEGKVTDAVLHQDGLDQVAKKKSDKPFKFEGYVPARQNPKAGDASLPPGGKSLEAVMTLMSDWVRTHPDFRVRSEQEDDEGGKDENICLVHNSQWKARNSVKEPYQVSYVEFSSGTNNDYLTYFPLTRTTVRDNHWSRDEANLNRLTDWRTALSPASVARYGFQAELLTNTPPFCLQISKRGSPLLKYEYLVDAQGRILRTVFFTKASVQIEWFRDWDFDAARVAREFEQMETKTEADKVDYDTALQKEAMAALKGAK